MNVFAVTAVALLMSPGCRTFDRALQSAGVPCGLYRWPVKSLTDRDARSIRWKPIRMTLRALVSLPRPPEEGRTRRAAHEFYVYRIRALLTGVHSRPDQDLHLALCESAGCDIRMIAEIPEPTCMDGSRHVAEVAAARKVAESLRDEVPILVEVTGVGFFDGFHETIAGAANRFELHPVLSLRPAEPLSTPKRSGGR